MLDMITHLVIYRYPTTDYNRDQIPDMLIRRVMYPILGQNPHQISDVLIQSSRKLRYNMVKSRTELYIC